jgi:nitroreductase
MCDSNTNKIDHSRKIGGLALRVGMTAFVFSIVCCANPPPNKGDKPMAPTALPSPTITSNAFLQILQKRQTSREFASRQLDLQTVSNLLWAAYGYNRPQEGKRTAPSAHNWQYIDIYVVDANAISLFDAKNQALASLKTGDFRSAMGTTAPPLILMYVSDEQKMDSHLSSDLKTLYAVTTAGAIMQNVYLFCAAANLNTGIRADLDRDSIQKVLGLRHDQKVLLAQSVGLPPSLASLRQGIKALFSL